MFDPTAKRRNTEATDDDDTAQSNFILEDLAVILNNVEQSTMGRESKSDFDNLFKDLDLTSTKFGRTEAARSSVIAKVLTHPAKIDVQLADWSRDDQGDACEYLSGQFASKGGKKAGEFYTAPSIKSSRQTRYNGQGETKNRYITQPAR